MVLKKAIKIDQYFKTCIIHLIKVRVKIRPVEKVVKAMFFSPWKKENNVNCTTNFIFEEYAHPNAK